VGVTAPAVRDRSQFQLLRERRFAPFFVTQFLGAFNDNVYKNALVTLLAFQTTRSAGTDTNTLIILSGAIFIFPFFLFSATAGQLADKYEKSRFIRYIKLFEICVMVLGTVGFFTHSLVLLLTGLFLMGLHSTMFGPLKYSILPQHLRDDELIGGNALVDAGTFVAILLGTILGILLISAGTYGIALVCGGAIAIAVMGYIASRGIPNSPPPAPGLAIVWNPVGETVRNIAFLKSNRTVFLSILGISWFWFMGATYLAQFPIYARDYLGGEERIFMLLLTVFSVGIGLGSLLCERLSGHKIEIGLVPFGSIGLTIFAFDFGFATPPLASATPDVIAYALDPRHWRMLADVLLIGTFGGFYIVPLYALVQSRSERAHQSRVIAGNNIVNSLLIVISALWSVAMMKAGFTIPQLFIATAVLNAVVAVYIYTLVPEFLLRFLTWLLVHSVYRLEERGLDNIPDTGAAVLVCNHVSFVDALIIAAACPRPVRFVMDHQIFRLPLLGAVFRASKAIPIAPAKEDAELLARAYETIAQVLNDGDLVCIFPEGRITDNGELYPFRSGIRRIIRQTAVPVVPLALRGLWGSFFSRRHGPAMSRPWRMMPFASIGLAAGSAVAPENATPEYLQQQVATLRGDLR
jgi:1-acyl-sn-glycerol-3-phosphate acyltransferase